LRGLGQLAGVKYHKFRSGTASPEQDRHGKRLLKAELNFGKTHQTLSTAAKARNAYLSGTIF
jgi:hypothetical protein